MGLLWSRRDFVKGFLALPAAAMAPAWAQRMGLRYVESSPTKGGLLGTFVYAAEHTFQYGLNRIEHRILQQPHFVALCPRSLADLPLIAQRLDDRYVWVLNANKNLVDAHVMAQYFHSRIC